MKTIRIKYPDWQAGNNPVYYFGSELLAKLIPHNPNQKEITIDVEKPTDSALILEDGIIGRTVIEKNIKLAKLAINQEDPDKIITIGGDCIVSQAAFDYLHGKYQHKLAIIWIDAHPDISNPELFSHAHAMVLANLLHCGDRRLSNMVEHPFNANSVFYLGIQKPTTDERQILDKLNIAYHPIDKMEEIKNWLEHNEFEKVVVHLDLDVLDPNVFHSLYFNDPHLGKLPDNAAVGKMKLATLVHALKSINQAADIVGFSVTEYLPWDAYYLKNLFEEIDIFNA